jgi:hypothetical protein
VTNCFLIRDPAHVIASYLKKNYEPTAADVGFPQQAEIFETVRELTGETPVVIDAEDVLRDRRGMLRRLCEALGVEFSDAMLSWPAGRRATDGVWAKYWYAEVEKSTGFVPYREMIAEVPARLRDVEAACRQIYNRLREHRLM